MKHHKKFDEWVETAHGEFCRVPFWLLGDYDEITVEKEELQKNNPYYRQFEKKKKGKQ